ncbi:MAG: patatin-like phospholipase family protein [Flavobacteriia bacterium]|nr:patatin-like phospholipase family protein [Flavobacteriia bacterium]
MKPQYRYIVLLIAFFTQISTATSQQKIGLVLSGGGATGLAHIGVLKALEERGIPIDYITGTSAGALVGAMYACGYSPEEIEQYVLSDEFILMTNGKVKANQRFSLREDENDADFVNFTFTYKDILKKSLPTNFITSTYLDFEMMKLFGSVSASYGKDYNQLFVPFRCVASDITNKKSIVFSNGDLNQSVRASMTFPFYLCPIRVNGNLLFDGGLYNNFPANIMYSDFNPDYIIGSNVSYNADPPAEDDLISQVTNMLVSYTTFELPCEHGIIIQPKTNVTTFDFNDVKQAIQDGYNSTLLYLDSIEQHVTHKISKEELSEKRKLFRSKIIPLNIESITTISNSNTSIRFAERSLYNPKRKKIVSENKFERRYYRLYSAPQVDFMYPILTKKTDSTYSLKLEIRKSKEFKIEGGGHFSSRPINTGYISLSYRRMGKIGLNLKGNSYFGKFYGSLKTELTIDFPSAYPISISPYFVMNRWDYFRSFSTFFEINKPSFLIQNEIYYGLKLTHPIENTSKSIFDVRFFDLEDDYYQTPNFTNKDTTDKTYFNGINTSWEFIKNTLNRKQFASEGNLFSIKVKYVNGTENSIGGSTSSNHFHITKTHNWLSFSSELRTFLINNSAFHLGIHAKGVFNTQSLFNNYTASLLAMSSFSPVPDIETFFLPEYRSPQHIGVGTNVIFTVKRKVDLRFDTYLYQPFVFLVKNNDGSFGYSNLFKGETYIASASLIYHTFLGPVRATLNYFPKQITAPLSIQFSYGFVIFNDRAIR